MFVEHTRYVVGEGRSAEREQIDREASAVLEADTHCLEEPERVLVQIEEMKDWSVRFAQPRASVPGSPPVSDISCGRAGPNP